MPMDSSKLSQLLTKYWNGETTLEEEQLLRSYFRSAVPDALKETAAIFRYFDEASEQTLSDVSFDRAVIKRIEGKPNQGKAARFFYNSMRIAAGVVVVMTATWFIRNEIRQSTPQEIVDTYDDPQMAFEETKKALMMISKGFGKAEEQAKKINLFNEAQEEIRGESNGNQP